MVFEKILFIFRRDLRLEDNTGLIFSLKNAKSVVPCFIFTPEQIENNPYLSERCLQFMIESLEELEKELSAKKGQLFLFFGHPEKIVSQCIEKLGIDGVVVNRDYTPYSILRDKKIGALCKKKNIPFFSAEDALLHPPEETLKPNGTPYTIFTPFFRNASKLKVPKPEVNRFKNYATSPIPFAEKAGLYKKILPKRLSQAPGGRKAALKILKNMKKFSRYRVLKDFPAEEGGSTLLSAHLKFTTCSVREVYHAIRSQLGSSSELIRAIFWRDFFTAIALYFPHVFRGAFHKKFNRLKWTKSQKAFERWCSGTVGVPIVDAGMRQMNETGYMHNRVRMVVASFLIKDLHLNWRWGEKYFAQSLIDYDPAVNNGNWQWVASTGCDAQPYFRIFNPWSQSKKLDPQCKYIKKWVPELAALPPKVIHDWHLFEHQEKCPSYPPPMVDHTKEAKIALDTYKRIS